jgi:hypothetical protein
MHNLRTAQEAPPSDVNMDEGEISIIARARDLKGRDDRLAVPRICRDWREDQWTPYDALIAGISPSAHECKVEDGAHTRVITRPTPYFETTPASRLILFRVNQTP